MKTYSGVKIKMGTRGSKLALIQSEIIAGLISEKSHDVEIETVIINTLGDKILDIPISNIGQSGVFSLELGKALKAKQIDIIVHSLKDIPTKLDNGTVLCMISLRDDPNDVCVFNSPMTLSKLPNGSVIGTSSPRRMAQIKLLYPNLIIKDIRGNLNTRISKLKKNQYDGIILAKAGLNRLKFENIFIQSLEDELLYAVGQVKFLVRKGALAVQSNVYNKDLVYFLGLFTHVPTMLMTICERTLLKTLEGGCCVPVGVRCTLSENTILLKAGVFDTDGSRKVVDCLSSTLPNFSLVNSPPYETYCDFIISTACLDAAMAAAEIGMSLARTLQANGASEIIRTIPHVCLSKPVYSNDKSL